MWAKLKQLRGCTQHTKKQSSGQHLYLFTKVPNDSFSSFLQVDLPKSASAVGSVSRNQS